MEEKGHHCSIPYLSLEGAYDRVVHSLSLPPEFGWSLHCFVVVVLVCATIAVPYGYRTGFFLTRAEQKVVLPWHRWIGAIIRTFFLPGMLEEIFWRSLLLPSPDCFDGVNHGGTWLTLAISMGVLFVFCHQWVMGPVLASLPSPVGQVGARETFSNPHFLFLAAVLTSGLEVLYYVTSGCIWPCVVLHWITIVLWLLYLGGNDRLQAFPSKNPYTLSIDGDTSSTETSLEQWIDSDAP